MKKKIKKVHRFPKLESNDIESTNTPNVQIDIYLACKNNPVTCLPENLKTKLNSKTYSIVINEEIYTIKRNFLGSYSYE